MSARQHSSQNDGRSLVSETVGTVTPPTHVNGSYYISRDCTSTRMYDMTVDSGSGVTWYLNSGHSSE